MVHPSDFYRLQFYWDVRVKQLVTIFIYKNMFQVKKVSNECSNLVGRACLQHWLAIDRHRHWHALSTISHHSCVLIG